MRALCTCVYTFFHSIQGRILCNLQFRPKSSMFLNMIYHFRFVLVTQCFFEFFSFEISFNVAEHVKECHDDTADLFIFCSEHNACQSHVTKDNNKYYKFVLFCFQWVSLCLPKKEILLTTSSTANFILMFIGRWFGFLFVSQSSKSQYIFKLTNYFVRILLGIFETRSVLWYRIVSTSWQESIC